MLNSIAKKILKTLKHMIERHKEEHVLIVSALHVTHLRHN